MSEANLSGTELIQILANLDQLLQYAVKRADALYEENSSSDPYRGLYIDRPEVMRLLQRAPGEPMLGMEAQSCLAADSLADPTSPLARLQSSFGLTSFEVDLLIVALAPDLDRRYERLYAYLQDDVSRRRPTVDLALDLLCTNASDKWLRRRHFAATAPLIKEHLLHLVSEDGDLAPSLLSRFVRVDEQIVNLLLEQPILDARLAPFCQLIQGQKLAIHHSSVANPFHSLLVSAQQAAVQEISLRIYVEGMCSNDHRTTADMLAAAVESPVLAVDLDLALEADPSLAWVPRVMFREARLRSALLYIAGMDCLFSPGQRRALQRIMTELREFHGVTIMAGAGPWLVPSESPIGIVTIHADLPDFATRRLLWTEHLAAAGQTLPTNELDVLAGRFRLAPQQIAAAASSGVQNAYLRATQTGQRSKQEAAEVQVASTVEDFLGAARAMSGYDLAQSGADLGVQKIAPVYQWQDIVLPPDSLAQLKEVCQRVEHQPRVLDSWGFGQKLSRGKGVNVLFVGASGTGKTMAAEVLANALEMDLYRVDLSNVVSKYIGETEKKLEQVFSSIAHANAVLFFDEADALFGKRSEVKDAHDRYANIEISYLLQRLEDYEGLVILATNMRNNLDGAFVRRMAFIIQFPQPEEADRLRIWQTIWPPATPCSPDLDLAFLARNFKLAGGNIKNIALAAAFLAADDGQVITINHLVWATRRELQKMGKTAVPHDFGPYGYLLEGQLL